jgi:hypothetical protein
MTKVINKKGIIKERNIYFAILPSTLSYAAAVAAAATLIFLTFDGFGLALPYEPIVILPFFDLLSPLPIVKLKCLMK